MVVGVGLGLVSCDCSTIILLLHRGNYHTYLLQYYNNMLLYIDSTRSEMAYVQAHDKSCAWCGPPQALAVEP